MSAVDDAGQQFIGGRRRASGERFTALLDTAGRSPR